VLNLIACWGLGHVLYTQAAFGSFLLVFASNPGFF
jgi:hypothetical protein